MEQDRLLCRIDDLLSMAEDGIPVSGDFVGEEEQALIAAHVGRKAGEATLVFAGGYGDAERKKPFFFPAYFQKEDRDEMIRSEIVPMRIQGSGYEVLHHRAVLGSVLALGLRRECVGDIVMLEERAAVVFLDQALSAFFSQSPCPLSKVGRDTVRVQCPYVLTSPLPERQYEDIAGSVPSPRLDCVCAALLSLSREKTQKRILQGEVSVNHRQILRCDMPIKEQDILSVRHSGKYRIDALLENKRSGRLRMLARKYK